MTDPDKQSKKGSGRRFLWLWHPHFWITAVIVAVIVILLVKFAK